MVNISGNCTSADVKRLLFVWRQYPPYRTWKMTILFVQLSVKIAYNRYLVKRKINDIYICKWYPAKEKIKQEVTLMLKIQKKNMWSESTIAVINFLGILIPSLMMFTSCWKMWLQIDTLIPCKCSRTYYLWWICYLPHLTFCYPCSKSMISLWICVLNIIGIYFVIIVT